jgi:transmembrane sensor
MGGFPRFWLLRYCMASNASKITKEELYRLLRLYEQGMTSPEETLFVQSYYEWFAGEPDMTDSLSETEETALKEKMFALITAANEVEENKPSKVVPFWKRFSKIAVAAAFILIAASTYLIIQNSKGIRLGGQNEIALTQEQRFKNDVAPGKTGAILKLSNGTEILLDTAGNGELANGFTKNTDALTIAASEVAYATVTTPKARTQTIVLSDGTQVWLNAGSSITFPTTFNGNTREVKMTGEVYFEVAKNPAKPFIAQTPTDRIEVLGTHFNINAYNAVKTTLLEGSVKIGSITIKPGQQYNKGRVIEADTEEVMAWKNGMFRYSNTNITEIMSEVERWYDVEIKYDGNTSLLDFTGGVERSANVSVLLKKLELTGLVKFYIDGNTITVKPTP